MKTLFRRTNLKIFQSKTFFGSIARFFGSKCKKTDDGGKAFPPCEPGKRNKSKCSDLLNPCVKPCEDKKIPQEPVVVETRRPGMCYENPCCPDAHLAYDAEHKAYLQSLKDRKLTRTWWECPERRVVEKIVCKYKPMEARPPDQMTRMVERHLECPSKMASSKKCPKVTCPGCCPTIVMRRDKGGCKKTGPANCRKPEAAFCAFSECNRRRPPKPHPTECDCVKMRELCGLIHKEGKLVYRYGNAKALKPPKLPEHCP